MCVYYNRVIVTTWHNHTAGRIMIQSLAALVRWLASFAEDKDGSTSSKKFALLLGAWATSVGVVALSVSKAAYVWTHGGDVSLELMALAGSLCAMAGVSYVMGKRIEKENSNV